MLNKTKLAIAGGLLILTAGTIFAQDSLRSGEQGKFFHLDYVVKELEGGKVTNARHYSTLIAAGDNTNTSIIRTGSKLPVQTGGSMGSEIYTYVDVGVNIDSKMAKEVGDALALSINAEISSAVPSGHQPLIRQTKWGSSVLVPIGKPTTIYSADDVTAKGQMQIELTATPVK